MTTIPQGIFPGTPGLATDSMSAGRGGNLTTDRALNSSIIPNVTEMNSVVGGRMENATALRRQAKRFSRLQKDLAATEEIIQRAGQMAERLKEKNQTVKLWQFASEVMRLIHQEMSLECYRGWK